MKRALLVVLGAFLAGQSLAGPIEEKKAHDHIAAVAAGDVALLMRDYRPDAILEWVGGPLNGRYSGKAEILRAWEKWVALNDGAPRQSQVEPMSQYANPAGVSVQTAAEYSGKLKVKVFHVLTYRDGELAAELWQIAPAITIKSGN